MKLIIGLSTLLLCATASANDLGSQGQGMYCSSSAEHFAKVVAKSNDGASKIDLAGTVTTSADPTQGDKYKVIIGKHSYLVTTVANDGICSVNGILRTDAATAIDHSCDASVLAIAKMNLDQAAKALNFDSGDIYAPSLKQTGSKKDKYGGTTLTYFVGGSIYKGEYNINITVDSGDGGLCPVRDVSIRTIQE